MKYTIEYDCGCYATGPTPLPNYCPEHGKPSAAPSPLPVPIRSCNRHDDCDKAEAEILARNPGKTKADIHPDCHCNDDCCSECFGN